MYANTYNIMAKKTKILDKIKHPKTTHEGILNVNHSMVKESE